MEATALFRDTEHFASHLRALHKQRRLQMRQVRPTRGNRPTLRVKGREALLRKTGGRCHICGGQIDGHWAADHVLAYAKGGVASVDNFLPAHSICNTYRWYYGSEEFQWILKLGVWLRTRIEKNDRRALRLAEKFIAHEKRRHVRRRPRVKI